MRSSPALMLLAVALAGCIPPEKVTSGIEGIVMVGPTCPVVQDPPQGECDDRPFEARLSLWDSSGENRIKDFSSHPNGTFRVAIRPGEYRITQAEGQFEQCRTEDDVVVREGRYTNVTVSCDSGIR